MRLSPAVLGVIAAVVLTLAFWFLLYSPQSQEQARIEQDTAGLEDQQQSLQLQIDQLRDVEARQAEIRAALARIDEIIPTGPSQAVALRQFQASADAAGVEIASVVFGEPTVPTTGQGEPPPDTGIEGTALANIPTTMVVEGGYFQVVDLLRRLEVDVPRAILIETVAIVEDAEETFPELSATWSGQMFTVVPIGDIAEIGTQGQAPGSQPAPSPSPNAGATPTPAPTSIETGDQ